MNDALIEHIYVYLSAVYILDCDFSEEEKYVIFIFQRTYEIRIYKKKKLQLLIRHFNMVKAIE